MPILWKAASTSRARHNCLRHEVNELTGNPKVHEGPAVNKKEKGNMKKLAILFAALTMTVYGQSPGVSGAIERSDKAGQAGQSPTGASVGASAGSSSTNKPGGSAQSQSGSALGGPGSSESGSSQSLTSLTPDEIRIIRMWIRQSGASGSIPSAVRPGSGSGAAASGVSGSGASSPAATSGQSAPGASSSGTSGTSSGTSGSPGTSSSAAGSSGTSGSSGSSSPGSGNSSSSSTTPK